MLRLHWWNHLHCRSLVWNGFHWAQLQRNPIIILADSVTCLLGMLCENQRVCLFEENTEVHDLFCLLQMWLTRKWSKQTVACRRPCCNTCVNVRGAPEILQPSINTATVLECGIYKTQVFPASIIMEGYKESRVLFFFTFMMTDTAPAGGRGGPISFLSFPLSILYHCFIAKLVP